MNTQLFWEEYKKMQHAKKYGAKSDNLIGWAEKLQNIAKKVIDEKEIDETNNYFKLFNGYKNGEVVTNKYGKKLYFKLAY